MQILLVEFVQSSSLFIPMYFLEKVVDIEIHSLLVSDQRGNELCGRFAFHPRKLIFLLLARRLSFPLRL
jgi:hypothetical protein